MTYTIIYSPQAREDIKEAYLWLFERTLQHAPAWHDRLLDAIDSLKNMPSRCPLAPEYKKSKEKVHHLIVGDRIHAYRIIFAIRGEMVVVLRVIHGARVIY